MPSDKEDARRREGIQEGAFQGYLSPELKEILCQVATDSIQMGMDEGCPLPVQLENYPGALRAPGAVFVTLEIRGRLRGCIGSYEARRPLVEDVAENAFAAAFRDPRFPPVTPEEWRDVELHISLLTPLEPFPVKSRNDLLRKLVPGRDGLLLEDPPRRATFLPQVWDRLPDPEDFLDQLLLKAGFPEDHWSSDLIFHRYRVEEF